MQEAGRTPEWLGGRSVCGVAPSCAVLHGVARCCAVLRACSLASRSRLKQSKSASSTDAESCMVPWLPRKPMSLPMRCGLRIRRSPSRIAPSLEPLGQLRAGNRT
eukprot:6672427-Prymnesium_polylepis.1